MKRFILIGVAALAVAAHAGDVLDEKAAEGRLSVRDFGAKGDGVTDDTKAIQAGIDYLAARGGGRLFFPFTTNGYLIASPGRERAANGRLVRAQIVVPPGRHNIRLEGEMPCHLLYTYQVRPKGCEKSGFVPTTFGLPVRNTTLHSTWDAPEVTDPRERPWAVICLDENVGDTNLGKELQENPCHTVGLMASGDQNDDQIFRNVASQGFKYGFVFGEHTCAEHLYVHNSEYAIAFADATHPAIINRVVAQHNARIFCALPDGTFGRRAGWVNLIVNECDYETGHLTLPRVSRMMYGVFDPESRFRGSITYLQGWPGNGTCFFPAEGGTNLTLRVLGGSK